MNNKQEAFVNEYLKDHNGTQAAIRAGYSKKTARTIASQLLAKLDISEAIKARIADKTMDSDEVLTRLADIARGDITDLMDVTSMGFTIDLTGDGENGKNPNTKLIKKIKQKVTTYLAKNESQEDREIVETEIELYSAQEALNTIAKLNGMIVEKMDVTSKGEKVTPNETYDRGISELAAALREIIPGQDTEPDGNMDTPK
jgi:phage terminase small subunit